MGITDVLKNYKPTNNDDKPKPLGAMVCRIDSVKKIVGKTSGKEFILLNAEVINVPEGQPVEKCTAKPGMEVAKFYGTENEKDMQGFANDMFTAGLTVDLTSDEALVASFEGLANQLVYLYAYMNRWNDKETGEAKEFYKVKVKAKKMITPENSQPQIAF